MKPNIETGVGTVIVYYLQGCYLFFVLRSGLRLTLGLQKKDLSSHFEIRILLLIGEVLSTFVYTSDFHSDLLRCRVGDYDGSEERSFKE